MAITVKRGESGLTCPMCSDGKLVKSEIKPATKTELIKDCNKCGKSFKLVKLPNGKNVYSATMIVKNMKGFK